MLTMQGVAVTVRPTCTGIPQYIGELLPHADSNYKSGLFMLFSNLKK